MSAARLSEQHCSIARTLAIVGERWTLVIMRDVLLGFGGFRELQRRTGASSNILSDRLKGLVEHGIVERHPVAGQADAVDYRPTRKGLDLLPVLIALNRWGDVHVPLPEGRPRTWHHLACDHEADPRLICAHCHAPLVPDEVQAAPGPAADDEQRREGRRPPQPVTD